MECSKARGDVEGAEDATWGCLVVGKRPVGEMVVVWRRGGRRGDEPVVWKEEGCGGAGKEGVIAVKGWPEEKRKRGERERLGGRRGAEERGK